MQYLGDVPTVPLDARVAANIEAGAPGVELIPVSPASFTVKLPSFDKPAFSGTQKLAIGAAVALFLLAGKRRRR